MKQPFVPESAAGNASAALASADPKVLKGQALYQDASCNSSRGDRGVSTAAAGARQKYTDPNSSALLTPK
jgi:hypothetical protein